METLFVGTGTGFYRAEGKKLTNMGLPAEAGGMRCPVVVDIADPRRLYAATSRAGVFVSADGGATWKASNQGLDRREIWWLEQHPSSGELWAGTGPSAMYKSADRGETWTECKQLQSLPTIAEWAFPQPPHISHVKHISLRPDDPKQVIAAVEEGWIIRSTDGGATWQNLRNGCEFDAHTAYYMPDDPNVIVSTSGQGVYRSEDGGESFARADKGMDRQYMTHLVVNGKRPDVMFTAAAEVPPPGWTRPEGGNSAVYRSEDQGRHWHRLTGGLPDHMMPAPRCAAGDPADPDRLFVGWTDASVWATKDGGQSFERLLDLSEVQPAGEWRARAVTSIRVAA